MPAGVRCALIPTAFGLRETHERERRQNRAARGSRLAPAFCARCDAVVDSRADHDARLGAGARLPQLLAAGLPLAHAFAASRQRALRERRPRAGISGSRVLRARAALAIRGVEAVLLRGARGFAWRRARPQDSSCSSRGSRREQGAARMSVYDVESEAVHGGVWVPRSSRSRPRCAVVDHGPDRDARLAVGAPSHISRRFSPRARRRRRRRSRAGHDARLAEDYRLLLLLGELAASPASPCPSRPRARPRVRRRSCVGVRAVGIEESRARARPVRRSACPRSAVDHGRTTTRGACFSGAPGFAGLAVAVALGFAARRGRRAHARNSGRSSMGRVGASASCWSFAPRAAPPPRPEP